VFSLSSFKGKIRNKKSFGGTGEMLWGAGRSPLLLVWINPQNFLSLYDSFLGHKNPIK